jgi:hypothetical protein
MISGFLALASSCKFLLTAIMDTPAKPAKIHQIVSKLALSPSIGYAKTATSIGFKLNNKLVREVGR